MIEYLSIVDLIVPPILIIIIFLVSKSRQLKHIEENPSYKYYMLGLWMKIIGGIAVCLIYILYYGFGDTMNYYNDCVVMVNMFFKSPNSLFQILANSNPEVWYEFDDTTGYMNYLSDHHAIVVVKLCWILCLVTFKSFIGMTILLAWISYSAIWRLYQVFIREFPKLTK